MQRKVITVAKAPQYEGALMKVLGELEAIWCLLIHLISSSRTMIILNQVSDIELDRLK